MKSINLLFIILFLFQSTSLFSMNESEEIRMGKIKQVTKQSDQKDASKPDEDGCTHWGLTRWVYGIKEYVIDRCICCTMCSFNHMDEDRAYRDDQNGVTTDCFCVGLAPCYGGCLHNNIVTGTLCFPLATTVHLLCLPCACCSPKRDGCCIGFYGTPSPEKQLRDAEEKKARIAEKYENLGKKNPQEKDKLKNSMYNPYSEWSGKKAWHGAPDTPHYNNMVYHAQGQRIMYNNLYNNPSSPFYTYK